MRIREENEEGGTNPSTEHAINVSTRYKPTCLDWIEFVFRSMPYLTYYIGLIVVFLLFFLWLLLSRGKDIIRLYNSSLATPT